MKYLLLFSCFIFSTAHAQDERYFRKMITGEVGKEVLMKDKPVSRVKVESRVYRLDLGGDTQLEGLIYEKKDGQDWFYIVDGQGQELRSFKLDTMSGDSKLYKINIRDLSNRTKLLILNFYEGKNTYLDFDARARLYFVTIDDRNLNKITFFKGPAFWHEFAGHRDHYHQRFYTTDVIDLNHDGIKEVEVRHNGNIWVYLYKDFGKWHTF
ncbi:MAG: hypothetical protein A2X86_17975 [Bdellovibrionales bacterium GWA2_49_15]|nr:MAG: hypothetical protein A2X86_17975 [Bdellovibrionales bacterium GWA2_49_15]HAZ11613.1 hypothetical protein [Bdellovibrionales bacterium]